MKHLSTSLLFISSLLFSSETFSDEYWTYTQRNFKPCQIMMDQFDAYAKTDPLKGKNSKSFTDWDDDPTREERLQRSFFYRAMKPGIGKAHFYPDQSLENLDHLFKLENMHFPDQPSDRSGEAYDRNSFFYDLSKTSGYVIITGFGGTDGCINNYTLKTTKISDGYILSRSQPEFGEGDLCAPSDIAVVHVDGSDYILTSKSNDWSAEDGYKENSYLFYFELYPLGVDRTNLSDCGFRAHLKITKGGIGFYNDASPAPRDIWKW